ncbi:hypothetical protein [Glycomyces salinus]|uniref:hypothetical protein n=1 Tax=Glycomyces salinus TaxID=980294 RepID=UPI0018EB6F2B|nr:hypothetical protein [Glycomyces salinus]
MSHDEITAAYRAHAKARLRGDTAEARRLADQARMEGRITHLIFTTTLFGEIVLDHFGDELDRTALAALTKRLHQRHRDDDRFHPLKAEAMVKAMFDQRPQVLMEIAQAEQPTYMWAVMEALIDPGESEEAMDERFDLAEQLGREWLAGAFEAPSLAHWRTTAPGAAASGREEVNPE